MFDIVIIGGGPGGYVAAIRAAQLGMTVGLVERETLGGVCLNVGCIPTKSLIHQAEIFLSQKDLADLGVKTDSSGFDYQTVIDRSRQTVQTLVRGVSFLLKKNKVEVFQGTATIVTPSSVRLDDGSEIQGRHLIVATGSRPARLPGFEFDETKVLSSTAALKLTQLPKSLVILGAGAIGCEFAYLLNAFGVEVHLVELADRILPLEDGEMTSVLAKHLRQNGIRIYTHGRALALEKSETSVAVTVEVKDGSQKVLTAEKALCVFGRVPNTENIGLDRIGIETQRGHIPVGDYYQTSVKGVYAVGDVLDTPQLAHVASKEGEIAVEHIAGLDTLRSADYNSVVSAVYCEPQIAGFGLREEQAKDKGVNYGKAVFPFLAVGKAVAIGETDGKIKVLYDPDSKNILGTQIVGPSASEIIHEIILAKNAGLQPRDIVQVIHAHPTLSEGVGEVMRTIMGQAIHY